jgi:hypothetical protein
MMDLSSYKSIYKKGYRRVAPTDLLSFSLSLRSSSICFFGVFSQQLKEEEDGQNMAFKLNGMQCCVYTLSILLLLRLLL